MINIKTLILALFILQPWFLSGLIRFDILAILFSLTLCMSRSYIKIPVKELIFILLSLSFVLLITILHAKFDISLLKKYITLSALIIGAYYIVNGLDIEKKDFLNSICLMILICTTFYCLAIFFEPVKNFALQLKGETYGIEDRLEVYRLWFPTSAHTFHLGLFFVVSVAILLSERCSMFIIFLCIICASISARSALLMSIVLCFIFVILKEKKYFFIIILIIPIIYFLMNTVAEEYTQVKYILEPIEQLLSTGTLQSKSSNELLEKHLFWPEFKTLILGDGQYMNANGTFYGYTDSGILRPILYGGILFQVFYFIFSFKYISILRMYGVYGIITIILLYLANIKAEILSTTPYFSLLVILYFIVKKENTINNN
ncbi:hypothetical protein ACP0FZ_21775 [Escherichia coli]|uniref:hypothetical protein n=1 Tax=Escherichia coli TaxID=562 RepID=UPI002FBD9EE0